MKVLNFGSLNIDHVYRVPSIARPGETVPSLDYSVFAGGKGANQSMALARAGAAVAHAGKVGPEGTWLRDKLGAAGVDVRSIVIADAPGGHAIIQVDPQGQNSIVIHGGTNRTITAGEVNTALGATDPGDFLLLQNETNVTADLVRRGRERGLRVVLNPAPMTAEVAEWPLGLLDYLVVNEHEGTALAGTSGPEGMLGELASRLPGVGIVLTLGEDGARLRRGDERVQVAAYPVRAVDTTAAGDTFIGYWLAALLEGQGPGEALDMGCRAAALSVTRPGAMDSIPKRAEVNAFAGEGRS